MGKKHVGEDGRAKEPATKAALEGLEAVEQEQRHTDSFYCEESRRGSSLAIVGVHQEWSLRLNLTQHGETYQVQT